MNRGFFADTLASRPLLWQAILRANARPASMPQGSAAPRGEAGGRADCDANPKDGRYPLSRVLPWEGAGNAGDDSLQMPSLQVFLELCGKSRFQQDHQGNPVVPFFVWLAGRPGRHRQEAESGFWDYAEESRRLALLDTETLAALALVAGVALHAPEIAAVLLRDEVLALRRDIGEAMYRYALYRGQYQLGGVRRLFARLHPALSLGERCALHGSLALRLVASRWPTALAERFCSALPALPQGMVPPVFSEAEIREVWITLKKLLIREVVPAWAPCFD